MVRADRSEAAASSAYTAFEAPSFSVDAHIETICAGYLEREAGHIRTKVQGDINLQAFNPTPLADLLSRNMEELTALRSRLSREITALAADCAGAEKEFRREASELSVTTDVCLPIPPCLSRLAWPNWTAA